MPFQQLHWEVGEKGLAGQWYIKIHGGLERLDIQMSYAKTAVIATT